MNTTSEVYERLVAALRQREGLTVGARRCVVDGCDNWRAVGDFEPHELANPADWLQLLLNPTNALELLTYVEEPELFAAVPEAEYFQAAAEVVRLLFGGCHKHVVEATKPCDVCGKLTPSELLRQAVRPSARELSGYTHERVCSENCESELPSCIQCGGLFHRPKGRGRPARTCSDSCREDRRHDRLNELKRLGSEGQALARRLLIVSAELELEERARWEAELSAAELRQALAVAQAELLCQPQREEI